jgi:hypothetical protein
LSWPTPEGVKNIQARRRFPVDGRIRLANQLSPRQAQAGKRLHQLISSNSALATGLGCQAAE